MSVKIMSAVWEREDLDSSERLVMLSLADHADDEGACYPSIARICKRTSMSDRGVQKVIARLIDRGFLTVKIGAGRSGSNVYYVHPTPELRPPPEHGSPKPSLNHQEPSEDPPLVPPKRRSVSLPKDWVPSDRNISDAEARQFSAKEIDNEAAAFRDHHLARGTTFKDWDAAWRTWLGNARKFAPRLRVAGGSAPIGYGQGSSIASIVARRRLDG